MPPRYLLLPLFLVVFLVTIEFPQQLYNAIRKPMHQAARGGAVIEQGINPQMA